MTLDTSAVVELTGDALTRLYYKSETQSTNDDLITLAKAGAEVGTVVVAEEQTRGRGRRGAAWHCATGKALVFSYLADWQTVRELPLLPSLLSGVAVARVLERFRISAQVKWPNDLLINRRKVAGILTEVTGDALIIGLGLNVSVDSFPQELSESASSLLRETGSLIARELLLAEIIKEFSQSLSNRSNLTISDLRSRCALTGNAVSLGHNGERVEGHVRGLSDEGELILFNGHTHIVINQASEIRFLDNQRSAAG